MLVKRNLLYLIIFNTTSPYIPFDYVLKFAENEFYQMSLIYALCKWYTRNLSRENKKRRAIVY